MLKRHRIPHFNHLIILLLNANSCSYAFELNTFIFIHDPCPIHQYASLQLLTPYRCDTYPMFHLKKNTQGISEYHE